MVNLHQRDKNEKHDVHESLSYTKEMSSENGHGVEIHNGADNSTMTEEEGLSGSEFLLAYAGIFSSGTTDTSERIEEYVAEALKKKYE